MPPRCLYAHIHPFDGCNVARIATLDDTVTSHEIADFLADRFTCAFWASPRKKRIGHRRAPRVRYLKLQDGERRHTAAGAHCVRNLRPSERRQGQRRAHALALYGELSRLRMAHRTRARPRHRAALPGYYRNVWQRKFIFT